MPAPITFYSRSGCAHCDAARDALRAREIAFTEIDVARRPDAIPELLKLTKGRRIVPVIVEGARISVAADGGSEF